MTTTLIDIGVGVITEFLGGNVGIVCICIGITNALPIDSARPLSFVIVNFIFTTIGVIYASIGLYLR